MSFPARGTRPHSRPGAAARALAGVLACALGAAACDPFPPDEGLPFGRRGEVRIDVVTPLDLDGELQQSLSWSSQGPWRLTERILYEDTLGDETVRRSSEDPIQLAHRYAAWIAAVNDSVALRLFLDDGLPQGFPGPCPAQLKQAEVTVRIVDEERADTASWTRCAQGFLESLSADPANPEAASARVIEAARLARNATLPFDPQFNASGGHAYSGSRPFKTVARGEESNPVLVVPRVIEDAATWSSFWAQYLAKSGRLPAVDFEREVVLIAAVGTRQEAGDSVEVRRVLPLGEATQVALHERRPGDFCTPAPRVHAPFHVVVAPIAQEPRPIFFSVATDLVSCR